MNPTAIIDQLRYAKTCAKSDCELPIEHWVTSTLERRMDDQKREILHRYDLPRDMLSRWLWVIGWRRAKLQCKFPRSHIQTSHHYYDRRTGLETGFGSLFYKLSALKGQITKVENAITEYIAFQKQDNMFFDMKTDVILLKAYRKLEQKKKNYAEMLDTVEQEVIRHKFSQSST